MEYQVRYRAIRDDKILCEVVAIEQGVIGPIITKGTGDSKEGARQAAIASTRDPQIIDALAASS